MSFTHGPEDSFLQEHRRRELAYAISGEGPPLVMSASWLTHLSINGAASRGGPGSRRSLASTRSCATTPAVAGSRTAIRRLSFETWVRDFECVFEAAGFERFSLLGTCWGGPIAMEYAAGHSERVAISSFTAPTSRPDEADRSSQPSRGREVLLDLPRLGWGQENHAFLQVWASQFQPGGTLEHLRSWSEQLRAATSAHTAVRRLHQL